MGKNNSSRRIEVLRDSVARRIAAGEVIDRPQAVVRELIDNSIDAGSTTINLYIYGGGTDRIRLVDDGSGMEKEDLEKCFLPHATSKIVDFEDIYSTKSLGFRGEALSSIAACSKLSIISSADEDKPAWKLDIRDGKLQSLSEHRGSRGTIIDVRDLFFSMPGRKNFLKSTQTESAQCRSMFIEKAVAEPSINFRFFADDKLKLFLPASPPLERVSTAYGSILQKAFLEYFQTDANSISLSAVLGTPSLYRKDRKYIHIYINKRRVSDYSLVQAVDYAFSSYLPGGCHPVCFLFLEIPPEHVDFNIHPAKREVKFRNLPSIHHTVTDAIGRFLSGRTLRKPAAPEPARSMQSDFYFDRGSAAAAYDRVSGLTDTSRGKDSIFSARSLESITAEIDKKPAPLPPEYPAGRPLVYLGQVFNLFLIFEHGDDLLIIDQHAAHERIIFNSLSEKKQNTQELLVPLEFSLEHDEETAFEKNLSDYEALGFELQKAEPGRWLINTMPALCSGMEDDVVSFFRNRVSGITELKKELFAMISCRSAIKDGDSIDSVSAVEIASKVLEMENPRCPHGRPVLQLITRDQLFHMFGRTF